MQNTVLISKAMLFHKIAIIHGKGEFTTNKGSISNVPIETPIKMGSEIQGSRLLRNSSPIHYLWSVQLLEIS